MSIDYKVKREVRECSNPGTCAYKSYFGRHCIAQKRIVWYTCRFRVKHGEVKDGEEVRTF